jgi:hypothetical protein
MRDGIAKSGAVYHVGHHSASIINGGRQLRSSGTRVDPSIAAHANAVWYLVMTICSA